MIWFSEFIKECRSIYQKENGLGDIINEFTNYEIGNLGENYIKRKLSRLKYLIYLSPLSHTPADVWGLKLRSYFYHLSLFQVKTSLNNSPRKLNVSDMKKFNEFARFVRDHFYISELVPKECKDKSLVVSYGYIGLVIKVTNDKKSYKVFDSSFGGQFIKNIPKEKVQIVRKLVLNLHEQEVRS